jgi:hypothetical protein
MLNVIIKNSKVTLINTVLKDRLDVPLDWEQIQREHPEFFSMDAENGKERELKNWWQPQSDNEESSDDFRESDTQSASLSTNGD